MSYLTLPRSIYHGVNIIFLRYIKDNMFSTKFSLTIFGGELIEYILLVSGTQEISSNGQGRRGNFEKVGPTYQ